MDPNSTPGFSGVQIHIGFDADSVPAFGLGGPKFKSSYFGIPFSTRIEFKVRSHDPTRRKSLRTADDAAA